MALLTTAQKLALMREFMSTQVLPAPANKTQLAAMVDAVDTRLQNMQDAARAALTGRLAGITDHDMTRLIMYVAQKRHEVA